MYEIMRNCQLFIIPHVCSSVKLERRKIGILFLIFSSDLYQLKHISNAPIKATIGLLSHSPVEIEYE